MRASMFATTRSPATGDVGRSILLRIVHTPASIAAMSIAEAAARDGLSQSDVKISVHRGLKALAKQVLGQ
jgi:hypothetical protein